jgi:hypothetical protein
VQTVGVTQVLDVWSKRGARARAAQEGVTRRRLLTEDALREIAYAVRSAFADVAREQEERDLAREVAKRYSDTVRLSQARYRAGDISEAELRKIELESIRYDNAVIDADMQWEVSRGRLAALLGLPSARALPGERVQVPAARSPFDVVQPDRHGARAPPRPARRRRGAHGGRGRARGRAPRGLARRRGGRGVHAQQLHGFGRQPEHARPGALAAAAALRPESGEHRAGAARRTAGRERAGEAARSRSRATWRRRSARRRAPRRCCASTRARAARP